MNSFTLLANKDQSFPVPIDSPKNDNIKVNIVASNFENEGWRGASPKL